MHKIFNISFEKLSEKFNEIFEEWGDDFYVSKKQYIHEEDELNFKYRYAIQTAWCDGKEFYELILVPNPECLSDKMLEEVCKCCGVEKDEVEFYDIVSYCGGVMMGNEAFEQEDESVDETKLDEIANVVETIDSLRGFYLDRYVNRIGTTGWDMINWYIKEENPYKF